MKIIYVKLKLLYLIFLLFLVNNVIINFYIIVSIVYFILKF